MLTAKAAARQVVEEWGAEIPKSLFAVIERAFERRDREWNERSSCTCTEHPTLGFRPTEDCPTHSG